MFGQKLRIARLYFFLLLGIIFLVSCAKPAQPPIEATAPPQQAPPPDPMPPPSPPDLPLPKPAELQAKINGVYQGTVNVDTSYVPYFLVADFNGDLSQDVAVVVKPVESRLEDINHELANWLRGDPLKGVLPTSKVVTKEKSDDYKVNIERGDMLLAIVHGYGPDGWRNAEATQTYLLRNSVGKDMKTDLKKEILAARRKGAKLPPVRGDVLREKLGGQEGFVYYNGARYLWYDPKTYKGEMTQQSVH